MGAKTMGDVLAEQRSRDELEAVAKASALAAIGFLPEPLREHMTGILTAAEVSPKAGAMMLVGALAGMTAVSNGTPQADISARADALTREALERVGRAYAWTEGGR